MQYLTLNHYIIAKFSSEMSSYTHQNFIWGRQWGDKPLIGGVSPWPPLKAPLSSNKPLHSFTNPEILVKIGPLDSELQGLESRPLKIKNIYIYIALPASLPSGLNKQQVEKRRQSTDRARQRFQTLGLVHQLAIYGRRADYFSRSLPHDHYTYDQCIIVRSIAGFYCPDCMFSSSSSAHAAA